ncbi:hypothetical protein C8Q75DRAFT_893042 [Abortiporus biennis]|nr:hypothetical protein C8Q75DRAFT_893042 [Abortiporus biennis]
MNRIHNIALQCIFDAVIVPLGFLNPQSTNFHVRGWLEDLNMRKSIALVCKQWRRVALPYLYSKIYLRRVGQLPALVNTLRGNPAQFNQLITSISFQFLVPDNCRNFTQSCVAYIVENCGRLTSISFANPCRDFIFIPHSAFEGYTPPYIHWITSSDSVKSTMKNNAKRITSLELFYSFQDNDSDQSPDFITFISWFKNLTTLSLTLGHMRSHEGCPGTALELKALKDFTISIEAWRSLENDRLHTSLPDIYEWIMPRLSSLTLSTWVSCRPLGNTSLVDQQIKKFLEIHAPKLSYLDISLIQHAQTFPNIVNERLLSYSTVLSNMLRDRCSSLQHLVLSQYTKTYDTFTLLDILLAPGRATQCHIDVWRQYGPFDKDHPYSGLSLQPHSSFLRPHVRFFDETAFHHLRNLPRLLSPFSEEVSPHVHNIHTNLSIIETSLCVFRNSDGDCLTLEDDVDDLGSEPSEWHSCEGSECSSCCGDDSDDCYYSPDTELDVESSIQVNLGVSLPPFQPFYALQSKGHTDTLVSGQLTEKEGLTAFRLGLEMERQRLGEKI